MEFSCQYCNKKSQELSRCTGCYKIYYCSKKCQKADWKSGHREYCKSGKESREKSGENIPLHKGHNPMCKSEKQPVENEANRSKRSTTSTKHQSDKMENGSTAEPEVESKTDGQRCPVCEQIKPLKTCARCKKISYCSKECQTKDWKKHKKTCESEFDGHIKTDGFKQKQKEKSKSEVLFNSIANARDRTSLPFVDLLRQINDVDLSKRSRTSDKEFNLAMDLAQRFYPFQRIINDLDCMPSEFFGMRPAGSCNILVAFISRFHHYRHRHCIYVEDKYGQEIYVAFYLDFDQPLPFFSWADLKPGRFICIQDPYRHFFTDGSVGIRVDDPSDVKIFDV